MPGLALHEMSVPLEYRSRHLFHGKRDCGLCRSVVASQARNHVASESPRDLQSELARATCSSFGLASLPYLTLRRPGAGGCPFVNSSFRSTTLDSIFLATSMRSGT